MYAFCQTITLSSIDKYDAQCATDFERLMKMNHAWSNMKKQNTTPAQTKYIIFVVIHVNTQRSCRFVVGSVGSKDFQRNNEMVQKVFGIQEICKSLVCHIFTEFLINLISTQVAHSWFQSACQWKHWMETWHRSSAATPCHCW